jgi:precorrin-6x reductase
VHIYIFLLHGCQLLEQVINHSLNKQSLIRILPQWSRSKKLQPSKSQVGWRDHVAMEAPAQRQKEMPTILNQWPKT